MVVVDEEAAQTPGLISDSGRCRYVFEGSGPLVAKEAVRSVVDQVEVQVLVVVVVAPQRRHGSELSG